MLDSLLFNYFIFILGTHGFVTLLIALFYCILWIAHCVLTHGLCVLETGGG